MGGLLKRLFCNHNWRTLERTPNHNNGEYFTMLERRKCIHCHKVEKIEY